MAYQISQNKNDLLTRIELSCNPQEQVRLRSSPGRSEVRHEKLEEGKESTKEEFLEGAAKEEV